jgi:FkbM family methyltransferase
MEFSYSKAVILRRPFRVKQLPLSARFYIKGYGKQTGSRIKRFMTRVLFRKFYQIWRSLTSGGKGTFSFVNRGKERLISFRARNTQFHSIYLPEYRYYEPETLALTDLILTGDKTFYDIGSNWGHFTLHVLSNPDFEGKIFSFEPMPSTFADLESTVKQAEPEGRVVAHCFGLSDKEGKAFIHMPDGIHSGNATVSDNSGGEKIQLKKLDELKLPPPALMKVDAEGHETEIFKGGRQLLETYHPFILFENFRNLIKPEEMLDPLLVLREMGYAFFIPLFIDQWKGLPVHGGKQDALPDSAPAAALALFEFLPEERCFLEEQINMLACHESRREELKKLFQ